MNEIKKHEFFKGFDWKKLLNLEMKPPEDIFEENQVHAGEFITHASSTRH